MATGSSVAIGSGPLATDNSVAIGVSPIADAYGIAIGANAIGTNSGVAIGNGARAGAGDYNIAIGHLAQIETAGFTRTTQIGPRTGNSASNGFLHYLDWPYLDRSGLGNFSNLVTVKEYVSDSLIVTNRSVAGGSSVLIKNDGTAMFSNNIGSVIVSNNWLYVTPTNIANQKTYVSLYTPQWGSAGNVIEYLTNNVSKFSVSTDGTITTASSASFGGSLTIPASSGYIFSAQGRMKSLGDGNFAFTQNGGTPGTITCGSISNTGGGTFGAAVTSTSTSTSAPSATEFVVAEWVRGLFSGGSLLYNCTNQQPVFTNMDLWYSALPTTNTVQQARTYNAVTTGQYLGTGIASTNRYQQINSPMTVNAYLSFNTGGGRAVTVHPEFYYCYSEPGTNGPGNYTNLLGDYSAGGQALISGTNLYTWVVSFPTIVSTNPNGFWVIRRFKVDSQANNPNVTIHGSGSTPSTIGFNNPTVTSSGMVQYDQNSVITNVLMNGSFQSNTCPPFVFDFSKPRQFTNTTTDITFTNVTGQHAVDVKTVALTITNASGSVKLLTIPGTWNSPTNVYPVTNVSILSVESWGTYMTNAVCRGIK